MASGVNVRLTPSKVAVPTEAPKPDTALTLVLFSASLAITSMVSGVPALVVALSGDALLTVIVTVAVSVRLPVAVVKV